MARLCGSLVQRWCGRMARWTGSKLAKIAFTDGRLAELNAIVHPPVIAEQRRWMDALEQEQPNAVAIYETALLFEASKTAGTRDWQERFDRRILVTAPEALRIARYVARMGGPDADAAKRAALEEEARAAHGRSDAGRRKDAAERYHHPQ